MSDETPSLAQKLYFLHNPKSNLNALESYLKKRNFEVVLQSDPKQALVEIVQTSPEYTFIAWDHPNERVQQLPKVILQSILTNIIPFCFSNDKRSIRALQATNIAHKLYPPITGPSIQRLLMKLEKENMASLQEDSGSKKRKTATTSEPKQSNMIQVKSTFQGNDENINSLMQDLEDHQDRSQKIQNSMPLTSSEKSSPQIFNKQEKVQQLRKSQMKFFKSEEKTGHDAKGRKSAIAYMPQMASEGAPPLTATLKNQFNKSYDERLFGQLSELIETFNESEKRTDQDKHSINSLISQATSGYCLVVNSEKWSGYLVIASEAYLEFDSLQTLIQQWLQENLEDISTIEKNETSEEALLDTVSVQGFYIHFSAVQFDEFAQAQANYCKIIEQHSKKTVISFFSANPRFLNIELHEKHDMITLHLSEMPFGKNTGVDIYLYLVENDKFILYLKNQDSLSQEQFNRLSEKNVENIYSSLEFEQAILRLRCENVLNLMIEEFNKAMA